MHSHAQMDLMIKDYKLLLESDPSETPLLSQKLEDESVLANIFLGEPYPGPGSRIGLLAN